MKLLLQAVTKYILGILLVGLFVFLPAGTILYPNGWLFMGLLFIPMLFLGVVLFIKAPNLLEKRLESKEKETSQKGVVLCSALIFLGGFILSGLDFRFRWTKLPFWLIIAASVVLLLAYGLYMEVMRENAYLSRTIRVHEGQTVCDTGLYGIVRHPMYAATILLFLAIPLVLGSLIGFFCFLLYPMVIIFRIIGEERVLTAELPGYAEYKKKVKYRLLPFIF